MILTIFEWASFFFFFPGSIIVTQIYFEALIYIRKLFKVEVIK